MTYDDIVYILDKLQKSIAGHILDWLRLDEGHRLRRGRRQAEEDARLAVQQNELQSGM